MEKLYDDVLSIILNYSLQFRPALREVCHKWHDFCASAPQTVASASLRPEAKPHKLADLARNGHIGLLTWIGTIRATPPTPYTSEKCMVEAAFGGHEAIVRLCAEKWGATAFNRAMARAACGGHEDIVRLYARWGATDFDWAMNNAAYVGEEAIVRLCVGLGATKFDDAIAQAEYGGYAELAERIRGWMG